VRVRPRGTKEALEVHPARRRLAVETQYQGVWDLEELYDIRKDPQQRNNLLGDVSNGMNYGRLDRFIADPELKRLRADLQSRMLAEIARLGGRYEPNWNLQ